MSAVKVTKGGKGKICQKVSAPGSDLVHERLKAPSQYSTCRTKKSGDALIRICKKKGSDKWEAQSVLTKKK